MLRILFAVLALSLVATASPSVAHSALGQSAKDFHCDVDKVLSCIESFEKSLKVPDSITTADAFLAFIYQFVTDNGIDGFVTVCAAVNKFKSCDGDDFASCTSTKGFESLGLSLTESYKYAEFAAKEAYSCGSGYDVFYKNYPCYTKTNNSAAYQKTNQECISAYQSSVSKDPNNICKYNQVDVTCRSQPFTVCNNDVANAVCEMNKAGFEATDIICSDKITCNF